MWNVNPSPPNTKPLGDGNGQEPANRRLFGIALVIAFALFFASFMPAALVAPVVKEMLFFGAFGAIIVASVRREALFADHVTGWDQAAVLLLVGTAAGFFVDHEAARTALAQLAASAKGAS